MGCSHWPHWKAGHHSEGKKTWSCHNVTLGCSCENWQKCCTWEVQTLALISLPHSWPIMTWSGCECRIVWVWKDGKTIILEIWIKTSKMYNDSSLVRELPFRQEVYSNSHVSESSLRLLENRALRECIQKVWVRVSHLFTMLSQNTKIPHSVEPLVVWYHPLQGSLPLHR